MDVGGQAIWLRTEKYAGRSAGNVCTPPPLYVTCNSTAQVPATSSPVCHVYRQVPAAPSTMIPVRVMTVLSGLVRCSSSAAPVRLAGVVPLLHVPVRSGAVSPATNSPGVDGLVGELDGEQRQVRCERARVGCRAGDAVGDDRHDRLGVRRLGDAVARRWNRAACHRRRRSQ